jgi:hypothetical protein
VLLFNRLCLLWTWAQSALRVLPSGMLSIV